MGQADAEVWVLVPGPALEFDQDLHRPTEDRLGLAQPIGGYQQPRQVGEGSGHVGVVGAKIGRAHV